MTTDNAQARRLNILVNEGLVTWVTAAAESRGISISALVREALECARERSRELELEQAAASLAALYRSKETLQELRGLDSEEFA